MSASLSLQQNTAGPRFEAQRSEEKRFHRRNIIEDNYNSTQSTKSNSKILLSLKKTATSYSEKNKKSSIPDFLGIKLPQIFSVSEETKKEEPVQLRQNKKFENPLVSHIIGKKKDQVLLYGARRLLTNKKSRKTRGTEELGVVSKYFVISEVDLAFKPSFEKEKGVTVFQVTNFFL